MSKAAWDAISKDQYNTWKHHPVTQAMFRYYSDYVGQLEKECLGRWKGGLLEISAANEMLGRVRTLEEIVNQDFNEMRGFYGIEEKEEEDAAQINWLVGGEND